MPQPVTIPRSFRSQEAADAFFARHPGYREIFEALREARKNGASYAEREGIEARMRERLIEAERAACIRVAQADATRLKALAETVHRLMRGAAVRHWNELQARLLEGTQEPIPRPREAEILQMMQRPQFRHGRAEEIKETLGSSDVFIWTASAIEAGPGPKAEEVLGAISPFIVVYLRSERSFGLREEFETIRNGRMSDEVAAEYVFPRLLRGTADFIVSNAEGRQESQEEDDSEGSADARLLPSSRR